MDGTLDMRMVDAVADEALMALDRRGCVVRWNPGAEKLYGRTGDEARRLDLALLYLPDERALGAHRRELHDAELHGHAERECWQHRADGGRFFAHVRTTALRGPSGSVEGFTRHVRDVTGGLEYEAVLRRSEQRFHGIVELASEAIVSVDEEQRIVLFNRGATRIFGYSAGEMIGQPLSILIPQGQREVHARQLGAFAATGATARPMGARAEVRGVRSDGEEFPAEASISVMEDEAGRRLFTAVLRDVSARRAAEREIQRLLEAESEARARAETALRARGDLLGVVAHEFGNALMAVGFHAFDLAESLKARGTEEERASAGVILSIIEHMGRLQRDLVDSAAVEAGQLSIFLREVEVPPLLESAAALYRDSAESRHVHLRVEPAPAALRVRADPDRILQVLGNLLSNAIRYSPPRGTVVLAAERADGTAVITVSDEGPGIATTDLEHVFEPFWHAGPQGGTGLGLAIARGIAEAHGGTLTAGNGAGRGAVFTLTLPFTAPLADDSSGQVTAGAPADPVHRRLRALSRAVGPPRRTSRKRRSRQGRWLAPARRPSRRRMTPSRNAGAAPEKTPHFLPSSQSGRSHWASWWLKSFDIRRLSALPSIERMHMDWKPYHLDALRLVCDRGAVSAKEFDGRMLRPLYRLGLIVESNEMVRPTPAARSALEQAISDPGSGNRGTQALSGQLSERQEEILRYLLRQTGPIPVEHVDGRVLRALSGRGLVEEARGWIRASAAAEPFLRDHTRRDRERDVRRTAASPRSARREAILRVVEQLENALPRDAELMISEHPAYADDVLAGLRRFAREMI